ncbi:hypothetical protein J1N35_008377 [Gossypium stocksii]|uniref:Uncharacterized protein n=1 Tax=Gossypium stocksii TaxID=47602 RepID=A0A9D3W7L7_9ROSI|nr:hypothetical protein J1N35_008377 [Gossypium stocksii]
MSKVENKQEWHLGKGYYDIQPCNRDTSDSVEDQGDPSVVLQYLPFKEDPKFNTARDIAISSSRYRDIAFVRRTNLDKKGNLCLPNPPITLDLCRGIFGIEKSSKHPSK